MRIVYCIFLIIFSIALLLSQNPVQVTDSYHMNYMPSLIQSADNTLIIVYEQLDSNAGSGELLITTSRDGEVWTESELIISSSANERHPSIIQLQDGSFLLYYLSDASGSYNIYAASSDDGREWEEQGAVDLGWSSAYQPINPTVIAEPDGSVTMSYDVLSNGGYVAHSDDGLIWDQSQTHVSSGSLNRIMKHSNGLYLVSYQRRTGSHYYEIDIFVKTSTDLVNWSGEIPVTTNRNSHDSYPLELVDESIRLYYGRSDNSQPYDLHYFSSYDGESWMNNTGIVPYSGWDTQPHPIKMHDERIALAWARGLQQTSTEVFFAFFDDNTGVEYKSVLRANSFNSRYSPNPFNPTTTITFDLPEPVNCRLNVYNLKGQLIKTLVDNELGAGSHSIVWNGTNNADMPVSSGIYFYRIEADGQEPVVEKMVLVK